MRTRIITARMSAALTAEIEFLKSSLRLPNVTSVLTFAIHSLYESVKKEDAKKTSLELFEESGLLGCMEAAPDLSVQYKDELSDIIAKKHSQPKAARKKKK